MNAFSDPNEMLMAFFDGLPWPVLMVDEQGVITFVNQELRAGRGGVAGGQHLAAAFPDCFAALSGEVPWLTPQEAVISRQDHGVTVQELFWLRRVPTGACLFITRQLQSADTNLGDAQLARLASLGFMVAGVCHEVANPLTAINSTVQLLRATPGCPAVLLEKGLVNIATNVQRVLNITRKLNDFSRAGDGAQVLLDLREAVYDALSLASQDNLMRGVDVECVLDAATHVRAEPGQIEQVFCNVFINAAQAMQGRGRLFISASRPERCTIEIAVRDTGPGIAGHDLPRLFEPFFTTKPAGHGTGLGLAISNEIIISHGGSMRADNAGQGGACFYVRLPTVSS